jgi:murein DD-endopeptidase MepM/ murein hydrolase activator NlpD
MNHRRCISLVTALVLSLFAAEASAVTMKDLVITNLSTTSTKVASGTRVTITYRVKNSGTRTITESYAEKLYLSQDTVLGPTDTSLGTTSLHTLDLTVGTSANYYSASTSVVIPNLFGGTYYLIVFGDATGLIAEDNENNNGQALRLTIVLTAPTEENNAPLLIPTGLTATSLRTGLNYFKFEVEPGYHYSFILNSGPKDSHSTTLKSRSAPAVTIFLTHTGDKFQAKVRSATLPTYQIPNNYSYAKSAIMFFADASYYPNPYYNYVQVDLSGNTTPDQGSVYINLLKQSSKAFAAPLAGNVHYHNSFGHREVLSGSTTPTVNGHLGIDIAPRNDSFDDNDLTRSVVPIADGKVIKVANLGNNLGWAVWIYHSAFNYTSIYAHLNQPPSSITTNALVQKGITKISTVTSSQAHLHLEIAPGQYTTWNGGYASGTPQTDPLKVIFER